MELATPTNILLLIIIFCSSMSLWVLVASKKRNKKYYIYNTLSYLALAATFYINYHQNLFYITLAFVAIFSIKAFKSEN